MHVILAFLLLRFCDVLICMCSVLQSCEFSFAGLDPIIDYIVVVKPVYIQCAYRFCASSLHVGMKTAFDRHIMERFSLEGWAFRAALRC